MNIMTINQIHDTLNARSINSVAIFMTTSTLAIDLNNLIGKQYEWKFLQQFNSN